MIGLALTIASFLFLAWLAYCAVCYSVQFLAWLLSAILTALDA